MYPIDLQDYAWYSLIAILMMLEPRQFQLSQNGIDVNFKVDPTRLLSCTLTV